MRWVFLNMSQQHLNQQTMFILNLGTPPESKYDMYVYICIYIRPQRPLSVDNHVPTSHGKVAIYRDTKYPLAFVVTSVHGGPG